MFVCMDEALIAQTVRDAKSRVVLCIPGFSDVVGCRCHWGVPAIAEDPKLAALKDIVAQKTGMANRQFAGLQFISSYAVLP